MKFGLWLRNMTWVALDDAHVVKQYIRNNKDELPEAYLTIGRMYGEPCDYLVMPTVTLAAPIGWFAEQYATKDYWASLGSNPFATK